MVGFTFIVEGMSVTLRPVLWSGSNLEVEGPSRSGAAKSPDLNPIEHVWDLLVGECGLGPFPPRNVWDLLDQRVRARAIPHRNVQGLAGVLVEEWGNISQQELANLVQSMRRRRTAVLNAVDGHTRY